VTLWSRPDLRRGARRRCGAASPTGRCGECKARFAAPLPLRENDLVRGDACAQPCELHMHTDLACTQTWLPAQAHLRAGCPPAALSPAANGSNGIPRCARCRPRRGPTRRTLWAHAPPPRSRGARRPPPGSGRAGAGDPRRAFRSLLRTWARHGTSGRATRAGGGARAAGRRRRQASTWRSGA